MRAVFVGAAVAFILSIFGTPLAIKAFTRLRADQPIRTEGPQTHLGKKGTPTMGGVIIVLAAAIPTLLWARLDNPYTITALVVLVWLGALGFMDDYLKITRKS